jgi:hypothetical protein
VIFSALYFWTSQQNFGQAEWMQYSRALNEGEVKKGIAEKIVLLCLMVLQTTTPDVFNLQILK